MNTRKIWDFLKLTRPFFLFGGIFQFWLGAVVSWREGAAFHLIPIITGQLLVTFTQLMTHYANEYYDLKGDRLNQQRTWFSGGSGVLGNGLLSPQVALRAARFCAIFVSILLFTVGLQSPLLFILGFCAMVLGWFYSAPPLTLSGSGWGEISATLVVAVLAPLFGYTTQSGSFFSLSILNVCLSLAFIHLAMLIAFQIPDYPADQQANKRTLAVRFGLEQAARIHNLALIIGFCLILIFSASGWAGAHFVWLTLPLAIWQTASIRGYAGSRKRSYLALTMKALALFAFASALWVAGFIFEGWPAFANHIR